VLSLCISLIALGLAAIDPIGIGIIPILLVQKNPYRKAAIFLSGSFISLIIMGLLFSKGLGQIILHFEHHNTWLIPLAELVAAAGLIVVALVIYIQLKRGKTSIEPSERTRKWLKLGSWHLFFIGITLVAIQSLLDIVFIVAMVRIGDLKLSNLKVISSVIVYSIAALSLQLLVVAAFRLSPTKQKARTLEKVHNVLELYSYQALIIVSLTLSLLLIILASK
jgi:Ca2+/Na+ antiporter